MRPAEQPGVHNITDEPDKREMRDDRYSVDQSVPTFINTTIIVVVK